MFWHMDFSTPYSIISSASTFKGYNPQISQRQATSAIPCVAWGFQYSEHKIVMPGSRVHASGVRREKSGVRRKKSGVRIDKGAKWE